MLFANFWDRNAATKNSMVVAVNFFHSFRSLTPLFQWFQLVDVPISFVSFSFPMELPEVGWFWWQVFLRKSREFILYQGICQSMIFQDSRKVIIRKPTLPKQARHHLKKWHKFSEIFLLKIHYFFQVPCMEYVPYIYRILPWKLTRLGEFFGSPGVKIATNSQGGNGPQVHALDRVSQTREKCLGNSTGGGCFGEEKWRLKKERRFRFFQGEKASIFGFLPVFLLSSFGYRFVRLFLLGLLAPRLSV